MSRLFVSMWSVKKHNVNFYTWNARLYDCKRRYTRIKRLTDLQLQCIPSDLMKTCRIDQRFKSTTTIKNRSNYETDANDFQRNHKNNNNEYANLVEDELNQ